MEFGNIYRQLRRNDAVLTGAIRCKKARISGLFC
jgi:hypothetical protein